MTTSIAPTPSCVRIPRTCHHALILDFLAERFPKVPREIWALRMRDRKVTDKSGSPISPDATCVPDMEILYFREVTNELRVPFAESIRYENDHIIIADKPHFLPTIPSGPYVTECLLYRLRNKTGNEFIVPINRLDRETAGLVLFCKKPESRRLYSALFSKRKIQKTYFALSANAEPMPKKEWTVETRIEKSAPWFLRKISEGPANSRTRIRAVDSENGFTLFQLEPETGKQHQLRLHMCHIGYPIYNDPFYPQLWPTPKNGFDRPLQLLAYQLSFMDPLNRQTVSVTSNMTLLNWPLLLSIRQT